MEDIYGDDTIEVGFDPIEEDNSDSEAAELYGFND